MGLCWSRNYGNIRLFEHRILTQPSRLKLWPVLRWLVIQKGCRHRSSAFHLKSAELRPNTDSPCVYCCAEPCQKLVPTSARDYNVIRSKPIRIRAYIPRNLKMWHYNAPYLDPVGITLLSPASTSQELYQQRFALWYYDIGALPFSWVILHSRTEVWLWV